MSTRVITIGTGTTIEDAATLMHGKDVSSLPVIDTRDRLVGISARRGVVRSPGRTDGHLGL